MIMYEGGYDALSKLICLYYYLLCVLRTPGFNDSTISTMIWSQLHLQLTWHYTTFCTHHARQMGYSYRVYSTISTMIWCYSCICSWPDTTLHILHTPCKTNGVYRVYSTISTMIWWSQLQLHLQLTWHYTMFCTRHARQMGFSYS